MTEQELEQKVDDLYHRMFTKYYHGDALSNWLAKRFSGGGNKENYKDMIRRCIQQGIPVKTGYYTTRIRDCHDHYVFFKREPIINPPKQ
jgi:hypothetical protein